MLGILCNLWSFHIADGKWMIFHDLPHQSDDFPYHIIWGPWSVDWLIGPSCGFLAMRLTGDTRSTPKLVMVQSDN